MCSVAGPHVGMHSQGTSLEQSRLGELAGLYPSLTSLSKAWRAGSTLIKNVSAMSRSDLEHALSEAPTNATAHAAALRRRIREFG
jgi:hypothetical protein